MAGIELSLLPPRYQRQVLDKLQKQELNRNRPEKRAKYGSEKATRGLLKFDSKKEARRFDELSMELSAGRIRDLRLQVEFTLQPAYTTTTGERVRAIRYLADFAYYRWDGQNWLYIVEDVKSKATRTKTYLMKRKLMVERLGLTISEV